LPGVLGLAQLQLRQNKRQSAKTLAPGNPRVRLYLSGLLAGERKFPEAIRELEELPCQTWSGRVMVTLGQLYCRPGGPTAPSSSSSA
jgi:hypothetical protein